MKKRYLNNILRGAAPLTALMLAVSALSGCGDEGNGSGRGRIEKEEEEKPTKKAEEPEQPGDPEPTEEPEATPSEQPGAATGYTLAERLCGRYSKPSGDDPEEYDTLEFFEFYGNVYAYVTAAMDDGDYLDSYSFWAAELLPDDTDGFMTTEDSCEATAYCFSVMSNLTRYWDEVEKGKITLTADGVEISGFDGLIEEGSYTLDDRVERCFYNRPEEGEDTSLVQGLWKLQDAEYPTYLEFDAEGNVRLYRKVPGREVFFACGSAKFPDESTLELYMNPIYAGEPIFLSCQFFGTGEESICIIPDDTLATVDGSEILKFGTHAVFDPVKPEEIERVTESDQEEGALYPAANTEDVSEIPLDDNFYGVWVGAFKDYEDAMDLQEVLINNNFGDALIVDSTDFSNLNKDQFFCVAAKLTLDENEAEEVLADVKAEGYTDAYVKNAGDYVTGRYLYTVFGVNNYDVRDDKVIIRGVKVHPAHDFYFEPFEEHYMDLVIDKDTVFAEEGDLLGFGDVVDRKDALGWVQEKAESLYHPSETNEDYLSLIGVFEVSITGSHIDTFYGSYWWD